MAGQNKTEQDDDAWQEKTRQDRTGQDKEGRGIRLIKKSRKMSEGAIGWMDDFLSRGAFQW
jgi:hypothetical protein